MASLGEQRLFLRIEEEEKEEEEEEVAVSWWAASSWSRWLPCPLLCDDRFSGAPDHGLRGEIPLVRVFMEQIVVCQYHRLWRVFFVPPITEEIVEVIQPGTRLSTCSFSATTSAWGESRKLRRFRSSALLGSSSSWTRLLTRPLVCNVRCLVQTVQKTVVFLQLQLSDGIVPGQPGRFFRALDDEEFFVIEDSLGVALTPGVLLPGVRPSVDAIISG